MFTSIKEVNKTAIVPVESKATPIRKYYLLSENILEQNWLIDLNSYALSLVLMHRVWSLFI